MVNTAPTIPGYYILEQNDKRTIVEVRHFYFSDQRTGMYGHGLEVAVPGIQGSIPIELYKNVRWSERLNVDDLVKSQV